MKRNPSFLFVSLFLVVVSMSISAQQAIKTPIPTPAERSVSKVTATIKLINEVHLETEETTQARGNANPVEGQRFIMTVTGKTNIFSSDQIGYPGKVELTNVAIMQLTGTGSSNAKDLTAAYLIFQDEGKKARPPYVRQDKDRKILFIWYPMSRLIPMQNALARGSVAYVWIGNFGRTKDDYVNLHADLHTSF